MIPAPEGAFAPSDLTAAASSKLPAAAPPALVNRCMTQRMRRRHRPANRTTTPSAGTLAGISERCTGDLRAFVAIRADSGFLSLAALVDQRHRQPRLSAIGSVAAGQGAGDNRAMPATLVLVMIVRDEERCIARCPPAPSRGWTRWSCWTPGRATPRCASPPAGGAAVHHAAWEDDFATARNAARLAHTDARWRLVLDADEWLEVGSQGAPARCPHGRGLLGLIEVEASPGRRRGSASSSWLPRLLPAGVRYAGRIREQPGHRSAAPAASRAGRARRVSWLSSSAASRGATSGCCAANWPSDRTTPTSSTSSARDLELQGRFVEASAHYAQAAPGA